MKRIRTLSILILIAMLATAATSCQIFEKPLTAQEVVDRVTEHTPDLKSAEFKMVVDLKVQGMGISIDLDGKTRAPEEAYLKLSLMGENIEIYMKDKTTIYTRQAKQTTWTKVDPSQLNQAGALSSLGANPLEQQRQMMKYYEELTLLAEEKQDGVDCYHLSFKINLEKVLEQILGAEMLKTLLLGSGAEVKLKGPINGEIWAGKSDFIPRKYGMALELESAGQALNIKLTVDFSKINQTIEMPQVP